jgi:hypothetical protein
MADLSHVHGEIHNDHHLRRSWWLLAALTVFTFAIHLAFFRGYGIFRDELYFLATSYRLDWGYVDMPPGVAVVAWIARHTLGDSVFAIRFIPAIFAALQVLLTGLTVRALGGRLFAQFLACLCVLAAPQYFGSYLNTDMFMMVGWSACAWIAARIFADCNGSDPALAARSQRYWLLFGLFAGLALQGKHAMAFFGVAFLAGMLVSPQRKMFLSRWLWAGLGVTVLIALPNLIWEAQHHWATYELLRNIARSDKNLVLGPLQYLSSNASAIGIFSLLIWVGGLFWFLLAPAGRPFRALGWSYLFSLVIFLVLKGKDYYLTPVYPTLFAGGAVHISNWLAGKRFQTVTRCALVVVVLCNTIAWPFAMPMMPVERFIAYEEALHVVPKRTETTELSRLPQQYADMFGWPEAAAAVAHVYQSLTVEDQAQCGIFARNYGEAGALEYFGRTYHLPHIISGHQNYWLWGPAPYDGSCLIVVGGERDWLQSLFSNVTQAGELYQQYAMPFENHRPIWIVRGMKSGNLQSKWSEFKLWY